MLESLSWFLDFSQREFLHVQLYIQCVPRRREVQKLPMLPSWSIPFIISNNYLCPPAFFLIKFHVELSISNLLIGLTFGFDLLWHTFHFSSFCSYLYYLFPSTFFEFILFSLKESLLLHSTSCDMLYGHCHSILNTFLGISIKVVFLSNFFKI